MKNLKLKGKIVEKYGRVQDFAAALGMSNSVVSQLLNNRREWRSAEISKAAKLLDIQTEEIGFYFLTETCAVEAR